MFTENQYHWNRFENFYFSADEEYKLWHPIRIHPTWAFNAADVKTVVCVYYKQNDDDIDAILNIIYVQLFFLE